MRVASLRVCELKVCESHHLKERIIEKVASDTYLLSLGNVPAASLRVANLRVCELQV